MMTTNGNALLEMFGIFILFLSREHYRVISCGVLTVPCKPPCLIVSTTSEIVALDFDNNTSSQIISGLSRVIALDVHYSLGYIFWTDVSDLNIKRSCIDGTNVTIIHSTTGTCDGLAVEWMRYQLYWTDTTDDVIRVSDLEGKNTRILISLGLDEPRGIALDPERGSMFWTDWGAAPKIETATLNGTERTTLVNTNLQWPNGITLDRKHKLIFWVDAGKNRLESINYNGNNRTLLFARNDFHFFGVTFDSPYIFISEWNYKSVFKMNISNGTIAGTYYFGGLNKIMGIVPYDSSWQRQTITCSGLPSPTNGTRLGCSGNATEFYDTVCRFGCNNGYVGSGSQIRRCQENRTWSGEEFVCQKITCPGLPSPINGTRLGCSGNATEFYDTVCRFGCNNGYVGSGSQIRRCQENRTWSGEEFVCQKITCPGLPSPTNGTRLGCSGNATEFYDTVCRFGCNNGYVGSGSHIRRCQDNKTWSGEEFVCQKITCPGLLSPINGTKLGCSGNATEFYDTVCQFGCNNGYVGSGSQIRRCQENKTWSGEEFVCQKIPLPCNSPCLLVTTPDRILALTYDTNSSSVVIPNSSYATALDYYYNDYNKRGFIFWTDRVEKSIKRSNMDGTNIKVIYNGPEECYGLAVDWNSLQLYGTDLTNDTIWVSDFEGSNRRKVISDLDTPTGIALDPHEGLMFWNAWGDTPKVEKSNLDGTQRFVMVTSNHTGPSGITLDRRNKLVYWVNEYSGAIESVDYNGNNRTLLFQQIGLNFYSVSFISPYLFTTGWNTNGILKFDVFNGTVVGVLLLSRGGAYGLVAYDSYRQISGITCPGLPSPTNGTRLGCSGNATEFYDTVCRFRCNNGYVGSGSQIRRCQENKTWSGDEFVCQIVMCPTPLPPANSVRQGCTGNATEYPYNTECQFSCIEGYKLIGSSLRKCEDNGLWSGGGEFYCERITCPGLPSPTNGTRLGCSGNATEFYDTVCQFECNNGYVGSGSQIRRCQENKTWSGEEFVCQRITCPGLPSPTNGTRLGCSGNATEFYDTVCQFKCNNGYVGSGSQIRRCQENKTWSGEEFVCQRITCPGLPSPTNGTRLGCSGNATEFYDTVCQFECNNGYVGSGSQIRRCQENRTWSGDEFVCQIVMCPTPLPPANSVRHGCTGNTAEYPYNTECQFSCIEGYKLIGSSLRKCQDDGLWSGGEEFYCERIICESLQLPPNVRTNGSCNRLPGNGCHFTCERGFNLIGSEIMWCNNDGSWTGTQPRCDVVTCPMLSLPTNGVFLGCNTNTTEMLYDTECRFSCKEGSVATGSTGRRCTENGNWTGTDLECTGIRDLAKL
ncbi:sushi, von Willebrand factor type A, EGF and pentraxin domain-containing protein 1-like isoform X7 [Pocillopora verrucosa]|uniref:sushi, von Willebrand factor type A, EGF and pentraxin domain-containing protein 1-like isoform X7 n=1 Tax=Pocillopora verrucosa TaxID=203993 RepID=UPI00333E944D